MTELGKVDAVQDSWASSAKADLFERRVAGSLADAVDGALDLRRSGGTAASVFATAKPRSSWQ